MSCPSRRGPSGGIRVVSDADLGHLVKVMSPGSLHCKAAFLPLSSVCHLGDVLRGPTCIQFLKAKWPKKAHLWGSRRVLRSPGHQRGLSKQPSIILGGEGQGAAEGGPGEFGGVQASAMGPPRNPCLPAAPGLWRAAGGGGDCVPGVEGLAAPRAPAQPRGEGLHRRRLQGAAPASHQPPAQVPTLTPHPSPLTPYPSPLALALGDPEGHPGKP